MADTHAQFTGSIPRIYDLHLGPLLFYRYAREFRGGLANVEFEQADVMELPFGYHDVDEIRRLLAGAGFSGIDVERVSTTVERPSARDVAIGFVQRNPGIHEINQRATLPAG